MRLRKMYMHIIRLINAVHDIYRRHGLVKIYREDGTPELFTNWRFGKRHGLEIWFREGGIPCIYTNWRHGKRHGETHIYFYDGTFQIRYFENDVCVQETWSIIDRVGY